MTTVPACSDRAERPAAILCIDAEPPTLSARPAQLEAAGYQVFHALTPSAAVELFVAHQVDLILSAVVVPGASGTDLSIFMRQVRPEVSVVLLNRAARVHPALLDQVDACIDGDANENDLLDCVRQVLAKQFAQTRTRQDTAMCGAQ